MAKNSPLTKMLKHSSSQLKIKLGFFPVYVSRIYVERCIEIAPFKCEIALSQNDHLNHF